jgi:aminopeptidase N
MCKVVYAENRASRRVRRGSAVLSGRKRKTGSRGLRPPCRTTARICGFRSKIIRRTKPKLSLHFTVPEPLVAASNGKLQSVVKNADGTRTFNWFVSKPISNYNIALNVAPYKLIEDKMQSVAGDTIPIAFYVLPEHYDKGQELIDKTKDYVRFFEEYLGPYPFRADKLGIAETPHLGMEHQSIIAYGNEFKYDADGVDWLMFHELGHEWWANLVTAKDWNDFWIHEGFQSFMDALYKEKLNGKQRFVYQKSAQPH